MSESGARRPTLVYFTHGEQPLSTRLQKMRSAFHICQVDALAKLLEAVGADEAGCVLIAGPVPEHTRLETLDMITATKPAPVIFQDSGMTVSEAAQLTRNGAHNCFGKVEDEDSLGRLSSVSNSPVRNRSGGRNNETEQVRNGNGTSG